MNPSQQSASSPQPQATASRPVPSELEAILAQSVRSSSVDAKTRTANLVMEELLATLASQPDAATQDQLDLLDSVIAQIDQKISQQLDAVLHHPDFRALESTWRGVQYTLKNSELGHNARVELLHLPKQELRREAAPGKKFTSTTLYKHVFTNKYNTFGGIPYAVMMGAYEFGSSKADIDCLKLLSNVGSAAHTVAITAAAPSMLGLKSWEELPAVADLKSVVEKGVDCEGYRSLRSTDESKSLCLTLPRFLARPLYSNDTVSVDEFNYTESVAPSDHDAYPWANAGFALTTRVFQSFHKHGWCARINGVHSGGAVRDLPVHKFKGADGLTDSKCPTETNMDDHMWADLADLGFAPLVHKKNEDFAVFFEVPSVYKAPVFGNKDQSADAKLLTSLPYVFSVSRFAHYLKTMARDALGRNMEEREVESWLNGWLSENYVLLNDNASEEEKASKPLREASVEVLPVAGHPGLYDVKIKLRPHFQLKALKTSLELVSRMRKPGSAA